MGAGIEVVNTVRPQVEDYIRKTYPNVQGIRVMDIDNGMLMSTNLCGVVTFTDDISYNGTFTSMPSRKEGHVDLWDTKTREVMAY